MVPRSTPHANERGIALVMALLVLLVLSLLAVVLMTSVQVGTKIAGHNLREAQALNVAEAGVSEALAQIRAGNAMPDMNPRQVTQIFLAAAGNVPVLGADSIAVPTGQTGTWLNYSTPGKGPNVLTVEYKTDAARTTIFRYDPNRNPPVNTATGYPIYRITSTGSRGGDLRRIVTEVIKKPVIGVANAALVADVGINFSGNSVVCGYNHRSDTPTGTGEDGRIIGGVGSCAENLGIQHWETGAGDKPGAWSSSTITTGGAAQQFGDPVISENQTDFYPGPWAALSMEQADFFAWMGTPVTTEPTNPTGVYYLDNNSVTQDQSGSFAYHGGDGRGMLYVDGDLTINGNFNYRGLIYIEGDLNINGTCWILGSIIVRGKTEVKIANGTCTILYSKDAIEQNITQFGGQFVNLSWREGM